MYLIAIAWMYVVLMMAIAEGMAPNGGWLGAFFTLFLYGVLPLAIVLYLLGTPMRRQRKAQQARAAETHSTPEPQACDPETKPKA